MSEITHIIENLPRVLYRSCEVSPSQERGVYAFYLSSDRSQLQLLQLDENGLLYIGMTEDSFQARNHFTHTHSGFSTFRRSLGALLKEDLGLRAQPRSGGSSPNNIDCYRFHPEGEAALSA